VFIKICTKIQQSLDAVEGGLYSPNGGGMVAAKADMEWYHKAGQLTGNFADLNIEDFWYMKPLMDAQ
jgi:NitT/TauT family transport system substrate-binding protein